MVIENMKNIQLQLLESAAKVLKPDGKIIYSTCTIDPEENEQVASNLIGTSRVVSAVLNNFPWQNKTGRIIDPGSHTKNKKKHKGIKSERHIFNFKMTWPTGAWEKYSR